MRKRNFFCAFRVVKAAHATLAFACWLVAVLSAIVEPGCSFDECVPHVRKLRDPCFGGEVAA